MKGKTSKSQKHHCKFCGKLMVRGRVVGYDEKTGKVKTENIFEGYNQETGKACYGWRCPLYNGHEYNPLSFGVIFLGKGTKHCEYSELNNWYLNGETNPGLY